ncbi:MAG TPA: TonB-dependent receptor [Candidatus Acidoferrum sp.]|nr:TonB-dependent receptor [Candidatus Acidoferrum sp.]
MKRRGFLRFFILLLVCLSCKTSSPAQNKSADASISGTIVDATGGAVGGGVVTATSQETRQIAASATSKSNGSYTLVVSAGRYRVRFVRAPFNTLEEVVDLRAGESRVLNSRLTLERLSSSVVVTAQAEPTLLEQATAPVSIISREEIEARQAVGLTDALLFAPGIAIGRTGAEGGSASVFLNGGNSNFTKVLVDGAPINPPGGAADFSSLTLDNIDKVEIVRGAESAIYGTDAVSGVIQLFTHRGETRVPEVNVFVEGGSFSTARGGAEVGGLLGNFDYSAASSYLETDGQGPNDSFINRTLSGNFGYRFSETNQLRLTLRNNTSNAGIPGQTIFEPPSLHQHYDQRIFSANARWDFSTGEHWHHEISGSESYTRQHNDNPIQSFFATDPKLFCPQANPASVPTAEFCDFTGDSRFAYNRTNVTAQSSYVRSNFGVTADYEYEVENAFLSTVDVNHARRNNQAGFLDFRYRPLQRVSLNFGGRAEANANFGTRVVPRIGGSVAARYGTGMVGDTLFRAFYGQGIKEPRFDQTLGDNFGDLGNPSLKPESSKNWSAGIEQKLLNDRVRLSADYFYNSFYNIVSFAFCTADPTNPAGNSCGLTIPGAPATGFGFFFNTDRALVRGISVAGESKFTRWLNVAGNYTYDDTRVLQAPNAFDPSELPGNHLIRRPVNSGSLTLNAQWRRVGVTIGGYFTGVRTDSDFLGLGLTRNPGYARFDVAGHYELGHGVLLYARAQNLFDRRYQDALGYPALGRDARVGVRYTFKGRD